MPQRYVSDELTHFIGHAQPDDEARYSLLLTILREGLLTSDPDSPLAVARQEGPVIYTYDPAEPFSNDSIEMTRVCFCDIPVPDLPLHMRKYSNFGLAFRKPFLVAKGANPVFYWVGDAPMRARTKREALGELVANFRVMADYLWHRQGEEPRPIKGQSLSVRLHLLRELVNLHLLCFIKEFDAALPEDDPDNFYMEREWRVAGIVCFTIQDVSRVIIPSAFAERFRRDVPEYFGQIQFAG
jgi:hypothetical protein